MGDRLSTESNWSGEDVAAYIINEPTNGDEDGRELVFYLNADNTELRNAERRMAERRSETMVESVRQNHRTLLCYHMYLRALEEIRHTSVSNAPWADSGDRDSVAYERYKGEMKRLNTTLLYAQREIYESLQDELSEEEDG